MVTILEFRRVLFRSTVGIIIRICDAYLPHLHLGLPRKDAEGVETGWRRSTLLVLAITLHNIPEGLAVGVLFGAAASGIDPTGTATIAGEIGRASCRDRACLALLAVAS